MDVSSGSTIQAFRRHVTVLYLFLCAVSVDAFSRKELNTTEVQVDALIFLVGYVNVLGHSNAVSVDIISAGV
jgi:hypothetical protein